MKRKPPMLRLRPAVDGLEARSLLAAFIGPISAAADFYSVDGSGNNLANPSWGQTNTDLLRIVPAQYADGLSTPTGSDRPSARTVSNAVSDASGSNPLSDTMLSAMAYAWGQFIDHDLDLTPTGSSESFPIAIPSGDPSFDPAETGTKTIPLTRSAYDPATGLTDARQQVNAITAWLDGSMVYGSDATRSAALRTMSGGGLKTGPEGLLPTYNANTFPGGTITMANDAHVVADDRLFAAGDVRANENNELTSLQTLFVREHNAWAARFVASDPSLSDEQLYQKARSVVIAEIQAVTFNEWLPAILGPGAIAPYSGYDPTVNPGITNEFSTSAFRFGHSMLGDDVEFLDDQGLRVADGIPLSRAFSNPDQVRATGIDPILKYLASDPSSQIDTKVVDGLRNLLFGPPGSGGLDLVSLNIQRGRDHGLADYNTTRAALGLPRVKDFDQITGDPALAKALKDVYGSVDRIDLWVGGLAEDHAPGSNVGPTFRAIIADQFTRIRAGDRMWFEREFSGAMLHQIETTSLADIIRRNTTDANIQEDVFHFRVEISGTVFADPNRDGRMQPPERGLAGRTVELVDATSGAEIATAATDVQGLYRFAVADGLRTGRYQVRVLAADPATTIASMSPVLAITRGGQLVRGVDLVGSTTPDTPPLGTPPPRPLPPPIEGKAPAPPPPVAVGTPPPSFSPGVTSGPATPKGPAPSADPGPVGPHRPRHPVQHAMPRPTPQARAFARLHRRANGKPR